MLAKDADSLTARGLTPRSGKPADAWPYAVSASACGGTGDDADAACADDAARAVGGCPSNTWIARARVADGSSVDKCVVVVSFRLAAVSVESP